MLTDAQKRELESLRYTFTRDGYTYYLNEGMTTKNHKASLRERFRIMSRHYGFLPALSLHAWFALRTFTKK